MERLEICGKTVTLWLDGTAGEQSSPIVYLNVFDGDGGDIWQECQKLDCRPFALAAIDGLDWNRELSPWECEGTVRDAEPFAGEAAMYLRELTGEIVPAVESDLGWAPSYRMLAGYSLAGLFALWAPFYTDAFDRVASVSGSLWFPGFVEFAREHEMLRAPERAYLSLGKKETRTPNRMMRHVLEDTEAMASLLGELGIETAFELNPGNHFSEPARRCAKGIQWILGDGGETAPSDPS